MTPGLKKFHKIMKLAMNITADSDRAVNRLHIGLLDEDLFYLSIKKRNSNIKFPTIVISSKRKLNSIK
jgi:hypothetical protein